MEFYNTTSVDVCVRCSHARKAHAVSYLDLLCTGGGNGIFMSFGAGDESGLGGVYPTTEWEEKRI